jgi:hypothetical protein
MENPSVEASQRSRNGLDIGYWKLEQGFCAWMGVSRKAMDVILLHHMGECHKHVLSPVVICTAKKPSLAPIPTSRYEQIYFPVS